jgi:signal transduction histidine kinase
VYDAQPEARREDGWLFANEAEIHQLLTNLVVNAAEAIPGREGQVSIRVRRSKDWRKGHAGVRILIADSGAGIEQAVRKRMFEPFFTTKQQKGVGLGLSVAQWVVAKHSGSLRVRSSTRPGRSGTVFSVFLPYAKGGAFEASSAA